MYVDSHFFFRIFAGFQPLFVIPDVALPSQENRESGVQSNEHLVGPLAFVNEGIGEHSKGWQRCPQGSKRRRQQGQEEHMLLCFFALATEMFNI